MIQNTYNNTYKYKIHFEFASNTKYIACISNTYLKYMDGRTYLKYLYLKYFTTLVVNSYIRHQSSTRLTRVLHKPIEKTIRTTLPISKLLDCSYCCF